MVLQCWYCRIAQPTDRLIACQELFLVQIPLCRRHYFLRQRKVVFEDVAVAQGLWNGTPLSVLLAGFDCFGIYAHSPSTLVTFLVEAEAVQGLQGEDVGESFINASDTGAAVLNECMWFFVSWMHVCVPLSGLAGKIGVSQAFAFTRGRHTGPPDTPTVLCVSLQRGWNCTSKVAVEVTYDYLIWSPPPSKIPMWINVRHPLPLHSSPRVPPPSYKSPGSLPARPASSARDQWSRLWGRFWFQNMMPRPRGPFQLCSQR